MTESAHTIIEDMRQYIDRLPSDEERILPPEYARRIKTVGEVAFLVTVCRELADAGFRTWMLRLAFCWKDLNFEEWKAVYRQISEESIVVYQFVWFAAGALALDIGDLVTSDPQLTEKAKAIFMETFPHGARPTAESPWWEEMLEERGVDRMSIMRRLASEGAPVTFA
jgi:hypothetical protein